MVDSFYPITFQPLYKDYLWGGRNLERLGKSLPDGIVAESWEISAHHDGMGIVASGRYKGKTLEALVNQFGEVFLGSRSYKQYRNKFPLLLKFIDANDRLSVQVHPNDEYARTHENDLGKTEMWYVLDAQPDAHILYGLTRRMSKDEFRSILNKGRIGDILKSVPVKKGDVIYIPAGTVHAIGSGILIAEIQQNSNATYRLYDYDRKNPDGTSRPLHIDRAIDSIDFENVAGDGKRKGLAYDRDGASIRVVVADPHFCTEMIAVKDEASFIADDRSFRTYIFTEGSAVLEWAAGSMPVRAGQSVLIPANLGNYKFRGNISALRSYIGDTEGDIAAPLLSAGYTREQMAAAIGGLR